MMGGLFVLALGVSAVACGCCRLLDRNEYVGPGRQRYDIVVTYLLFAIGGLILLPWWMYKSFPVPY